MQTQKNYLRYSFTITELIVAMGIFSMLAVMTLKVFSGTQTVVTQNMGKASLDESVRATLDLMENDIRSTPNLNYTGNEGVQGNYCSFYCSTGSSGAQLLLLSKDESSGDFYKKTYSVNTAKELHRASTKYTGGTVSTSITDGDGDLLLEHVTKFELKRYKYNGTAPEEISGSSVFPEIVILTIEAVSEENLEKYNTEADAEKTDYVQKYTRTIYLKN